jgi:hypothetical protein
MPSAKTIAKILSVVTAAAAGVLAVKEAKKWIDGVRAPSPGHE